MNALPAIMVSLLPALLLGGYLVLDAAPFGAAPEGERLARIQQSPEWHGEQFVNPQAQWRDAPLLRILTAPSVPGLEPQAPVPVVHTDPAMLAQPPASGLRITWFGHSSALIEIDGTRLLIDPLWSERASPFPFFGPARWYAPPIALAQLPAIDAVLISHDHYDHLDQAVVMALAPTRTVFIVPLGIGAHLRRWGIAPERIIELDWWQSARVGALELVATPSRHSSGRKGGTSNQTLWSGFAMIGPRHRAWYSGDSSFHDALAEIGERYGPFDVTLIEAGQYDSHWPDAHLGPELAVQAHRLVRGKVMIPVHWGLIKLANHVWTEPPERVLAAAARCGGANEVQVLVPRPGESVEPTAAPRHSPAAVVHWWPDNIPWHTAAQDPILGTKNGVDSERVAIAPCPVDSAK